MRGLERFRDHFSAFGDRYVLIGGTACDLAMTDAGLDFRVTRDLDIVLCVEALDQEFAKEFWSFVKAGGYEINETSTGEKRFYRFQRPTDDSYPEMLELFSRVPDALVITGESVLTPIPIDDEVSSLSAILLDEDYYRWIHEGKTEIEGVPALGAERLIPLKARAWLDLRERREAGDRVDSKTIKKHKNDVFRLTQIVDPEYKASIPETISDDMRRFIEEVEAEPPDLKTLGIKGVSFEQSVETLNAVYRLG